MEIKEILNYVLYIIITVILPVVATYIVSLIKSKINESTIVAEVTKNEEIDTIIKNALSDVMDAVLYVNQTYTDSLKSSGKFDEEAQKIAFNKAYAKAATLISDGAKQVISDLYGSFDRWLELKIEASVNMAKKE